MDTNKIRESNRQVIASLGYQFNPHLPHLEQVHVPHSEREVSERILTLYACVACSFGFSKESALEWISRERLDGSLAGSEIAFLNASDSTGNSTFQWQVEALWSLTWAAGYHSDLDFATPCPDSFVAIFPNLNTGEGTDRFRANCNIRSRRELLVMLDLAYCLHWAIREAELKKPDSYEQPNSLQNQVIVERRRGLEWIVGNDRWDHVSLNT